MKKIKMAALVITGIALTAFLVALAASTKKLGDVNRCGSVRCRIQ